MTTTKQKIIKKTAMIKTLVQLSDCIQYNYLVYINIIIKKFRSLKKKKKLDFLKRSASIYNIKKKLRMQVILQSNFEKLEQNLM